MARTYGLAGLVLGLAVALGCARSTRDEEQRAAAAEQARTEPAKPEPLKAEAKPDQAKPEPGKAEQAKSAPAKADASKPAPYVHTVIFRLKKEAPEGEADAVVADGN